MNSDTSDSRPRMVFFGTPDFAVPSFEQLIESGAYNMAAVVTQPDKPSGRGQKLSPPAIKRSAEKHGVRVFQPKSIKSIELDETSGTKTLRGQKSSVEFAEFLNQLAPIDIFVCVAYGKLIPPSLLSFAKHGMINVHPSLLPRWRGAAPLQYALFSGDAVTGVTIMEIDEGLDSGPIYSVKEYPIAEDDSLGSLHDRLADIGGEMLSECIPEILAGKLKAVPQPEDGVTYAEKWEREDCQIRWTENAELSLRRIRTCDPMPGARTQFGDAAIKLFRARIVPDQNYPTAEPGTIVECDKRDLIVACGESQYIAIDELQFPGKKRMPIESVLRGHTFSVGERFS